MVITESASTDRGRLAGVLNAFAVAGRRGALVLSAWRDTTAEDRLVAVLTLASARHRAHGAAFAKRLSELGQQPLETPCAELDRALAMAASAASDLDKFECLLEFSRDVVRVHDPLAHLFDDPAVDPATGALLGRFIAETRDSEQRLRQEYGRLSGVRA